MATDFDAGTLNGLRDANEVVIRTEAHPDSAVPIWIVVSGKEVFVRSVRGPKGRWYRDMAAGGAATVELDGRRIPVRASSATDSASVSRVSTEYERKYRGSPWAASIVRDEVLPTTLRLQPTG